jgi:hypothetical protein
MLRRTLVALLLALAATVASAENTPKVALESNETLFTMLTAINTCGYDAELAVSNPLRAEIRSEVAKSEVTDDAKDVTHLICDFYKDHQQADSSRTLSQYVSLALYLNGPPDFAIKGKDADLPPDAGYVAGILQMLPKFYDSTGLHSIWEKHQAEYSALSDRYHEPLAKMLFDTEVYLKMPSAGYLGRTFTVYLEPMGAPGQTNARNYGTDYSVVLSPGTNSGLKMDLIRHAYLHYLLDPLAMKYPEMMENLQPLLASVKGAPMDASFKTDMGLLVTECLIRAIEVRTGPSGKTPPAQQAGLVQKALVQGFILTPYFYDALAQFEKGPTGLKNAYGDMIGEIDVRKEQKRVAGIQFASQADPELLQPAHPTEGKLLQTAEQRLSSGDSEGAKKLAEQALAEKSEDQGRALFILAQVATMNRDIKGAQGYFEQALSVAQEPKVLAWSHIYLGRIFDLQEDREQALTHYRAALTAGAGLPEAKAAAERGLAQPYEPPARPQQPQQ